MSQKRMGKSHRFTQSQQIENDSKVAKMDSSLSAKAQNDESVDCHENPMDLQGSQTNLTMTTQSISPSLRGVTNAEAIQSTI